VPRSAARKSAPTSAGERPPSQEDYHALGAFRLALRRFLAFSERSADIEGLTTQQHQAILAIHTHEGPQAMSVGELADSLGIKNHSAVGLVGRLITRGLITREPAPGDRRRVLLRLTPQGRKILEAITRRNFEELKAQAPFFADLLATLKRLERGA
jgi:DNA-binding MarR family transcriptional regulator